MTGMILNHLSIPKLHNGCTVEVCERMSNFITLFYVEWLLIHAQIIVSQC